MQCVIIVILHVRQLLKGVVVCFVFVENVIRGNVGNDFCDITIEL
jgi:hypothetical protein